MKSKNYANALFIIIFCLIASDSTRLHPRKFMVFCVVSLNTNRGDTNMALTDVQLRKLKPRDRTFKISDDGGLFLMASPKGSELWRLA